MGAGRLKRWMPCLMPIRCISCHGRRCKPCSPVLVRCLRLGGLLVLYGPFNYEGAFTSESNARFDLWLKNRDPQSGIRDFEAVCELAAQQELQLQDDIAMPANNRLLVWRKTS